jgi:hypothetical protein
MVAVVRYEVAGFKGHVNVVYDEHSDDYDEVVQAAMRTVALQLRPANDPHWDLADQEPQRWEVQWPEAVPSSRRAS